MGTQVASGSKLAPKQYSEALFSMVGKAPTPINAISGPAPTPDRAAKVLRRQSTSDMPVVRVTDLAKAPGDDVRVYCQHVAKLRAIMGDRNAEGQGASLNYTEMDAKIDMATIPVSAGGKMTQKRMAQDLRINALNQLKGGIPNFLWQRCLVQLAGARGNQDGVDWILPMESDPEFAEMMVNYNATTGKPYAPTFNRHYVVDGSNIIQGGQQLANIDATDSITLDTIDALAGLVGEMSVRMLPIRIPGDPAAGDDPIKGVLMVDNLVWQKLITDKTQNASIRQWQAQAMERARYGDLTKHPLFAAQPFLWNGILVRKMGDFAVRFAGGSSQQYVSQANRYTANESSVALPALSGHQVARSLFLGAQALAQCLGANQSSESGMPYSLLENSTNFGRNLEVAGEVIGAEQKIRFKLPDGNGNLEPTDIGVMVVDSVVPNVAA